MQFTLDRDEFLRGLSLARTVADAKQSLEILGSALIRTIGDGHVGIAATDLTVSTTAKIHATVTKEGAVAVNAKKLYEIVNELPGGDVSVSVGANNSVEIRSGKSKFTIFGIAGRDFPKFPDASGVSWAEVESEAMCGVIDKTLFSVSQDISRMHIFGVLFECDGETARMVSTDGHRLSKATSRMPGGPKLAAGVLIPRKGAIELRRLLDTVKGTFQLAIHGDYLFAISDKDETMAIRMTPSSFPPYDSVIPKDSPNKAGVNRADLLDALKRVSLMAKDKTNGVMLSFANGSLTIDGEHAESGSATEEVAAEYEGAERRIGLNAKYLIDFLTHDDSGTLGMSFDGDLDPIVLRPADNADYVGVVMPMRI